MTFTTTAMPRPDLLERTYRSFRERLISCDFSRSVLFLNVDPFPDQKDNTDRAACVSVARRFFGTVHYRNPDLPNFALALKWLWESAETESLFHLEDDWELLEDLDIDLLVRCLMESGADHVLLRAWTWRQYPFCLGPGLLRKRLYKMCAMTIREEVNPELILRRELEKTQYAPVVVPEQRHRVILRDLGRNWMQDAGYFRGSGEFITWSRTPLEKKPCQVGLADQNAELLRNPHALQ